MRVVIVGDVHGHWNLALKKAAELNADRVVQVGDTGIYTDRSRIDGPGLRHGNPDDILSYINGTKQLPFPIDFIEGNHEDFSFLDENIGEIVPGLTYHPNGTVFEIDSIRFGVLGGNYGSASYERKTGGKRRHFRKHQIEQLLEQEFDVLISHDAPRTQTLIEAIQKRSAGCPMINDLVEQSNVTHTYCGHYHVPYETTIGDSKVIGLGHINREGRSVILHEF